MQQTPTTPLLSRRRMAWGVAALVIVALLIFAGAALAQESQPAENPKPAAGLVVIHVEADSPAATAGVARGDIILAVDDDAVNTMAELMHIIRSHDAGDEIVLTVMHGDEERSLAVTLGDDNGAPELGLMAMGDLAVDKRMDRHQGRGHGRMPAMPFGRGEMFAMPFGRGEMFAMPFGDDEMFAMPFGRGEGMMWEEAEGALVMEVMEESAAATAGLQAGDVITGLNDSAVASSDELIALLGDHKPGDVVTVTYSRDDESATTEVTLGSHPDDETKAYLGVQLAPAGPIPFRMEMGQGMIPFMPGEGMLSGVMVAAVTENGPAATAGLEEGDWITAIDGEAISDPQEVVDAVKAAKPGDEMVLTVQGADDEEAEDVTITLGKNDEGGALLGVQIGGGLQIQRGPGGMDFDFRQFRGQNGQGMPGMPFFFGHPGQEDGNRFEFCVPQFRFPMPGNDEAPATPDARYQQQPGYSTQGA